MNLSSKSIRLRLVEESDAEFILSLRIDDKYNNYLSKVVDDVAKQKEWIKSYKLEESESKQFYFIIERLDGLACGTVRVYDLKDESFCWGSWILNENKTRYSAIESALLVYKFGFENLGYKKSHFEVMKENTKVISFHEKMGALKVREDDDNFFFEIEASAVEKSLEKLGRFL